MAQITLELMARRPVWMEDYLRLVVLLGLDVEEAGRFIVAHYEISFDGGENWMPLWASDL